MSYLDDTGFSSVFGKAADGVEFDKVLEADEEDDLIEAVMSLGESDDGEDDTDDSSSEDDSDIDIGEDDSDDNSGNNYSSTGNRNSARGDNPKFIIQVDNDHTDDLDINLSLQAEMAAMEAADDNSDFAETTGENDKDPEDIEKELEGRPDDGDNDHTDALDIDLSAEMAMIECQLLESESDFVETTGENDKDPEDIEKELEGRPDDGCNKHTGTFDSEKGSDTSLGNYSSADKDLNDLDGATRRAANQGENLYTNGDLSTESADFDEDSDPGFDMTDYEGQEDYGDFDDYDGQEDYDGQDSYDGVAESADDEDFEDELDDDDLDEFDESSTDDPDGDEELIDAADEDDGVMSQAEVEALVAAGGDDDLLDSV